jgi:hypothetical protein
VVRDSDATGYVGLPYTPGSDTSRAAAVQALGSADTQRANVLSLLTQAGDDGCTHEELQDALRQLGYRYSDSGVRTRCSELVDQGLVEDSGGRRRSRHQRWMAVWRVTKPDASRSVAHRPVPDGVPEREHVLSVDCWCQPVVESYGYGADEEEDEGDQRGPVGVEPGTSSPP